MGLNEGRKPGGRKTEASISETIQTKVAAAVVVAAVAVVALVVVAALVDVAVVVAAVAVVVVAALVDVAVVVVAVDVVALAAVVVAVVASKSISAAWTASQNILRQVTLLSSQECFMVLFIIGQKKFVNDDAGMYFILRN